MKYALLVMVGVGLFGFYLDFLRDPEPARDSLWVMGTQLNIEVQASNKKLVQDLIIKCFNEAARLDNLMSFYKQDSELWSIIRNAPSPGGYENKKDERYLELLKFIEKCVEFYSPRTAGTFDITVAPVLEIYRLYHPETPAFLNLQKITERIQEVKPAVGYKNVVIENGVIKFLHPQTKIDLGAVGKGYAIDKMAGILRSHGGNNIFFCKIDFGGQIYLFSRQAREFSIAIRNPANPAELFGVIKKRGTIFSVSTSAHYYRFREINGRKQSHIIDPRTCEPLDNGIVSVTVVAESAELADVLATAVMVLGKEKGRKLIEELPNVEAVIIDENLAVSLSSGITAENENYGDKIIFEKLGEKR